MKIRILHRGGVNIPPIELTDFVLWLIEPKVSNETFLKADGYMTHNAWDAIQFDTKEGAEKHISEMESKEHLIAQEHLFYTQ